MKIAVIGARGFVGSSVYKNLQSKHFVTPITRDVINVLDSSAVKSFLQKNLFDVIINCAAVMTSNESLADARNNFGMFINFYDNRKSFGKFINTASGAEFDRTTNIDCVDEDLIFQRMPQDSYGWGQNMKSRICVHTDNFYNIRIFNCFGQNENPTRIFPKFLSNTNNFSVTDDRYFDYFSIHDLCSLVENCIDYSWTIKDVNAVYETKYKISEVINKLCILKNINCNLQITSVSKNNYTGSADRIKLLDVKLKGLDHGLMFY